jgi:uncharacterized protein YqgV (UPF0045/DUF77 family)
MGTIVEGQWDEVLSVVTACFKAMSQDCERIATSIKIDYRANARGRLQSKVESVQTKVGRKLST